jgi:myo-inositol catabolism protein IolC
MTLGYTHPLYVLAFDHRGSFQTKLLGIPGAPSDEQVAQIKAAKQVIYTGFLQAYEAESDREGLGILVDEQFGGDIARAARELGVGLAMPVEKSGQNEFDFEYGEAFGEHILEFDPSFSKVLVRMNVEGDREMNRRQSDRLARLGDWLHEHDRKFLFELLVPATEEQLAKVGGDVDRYDTELRPELMRRAIEGCQERGVEVDIWKIEGVDAREDAEMLAEQARSGEGRQGVTCVVLGRGASTEKVEHWLQVASTVEGFIGFAIGRSIWWDALKGFLDKSLERDAASDMICDKYTRFVNVYDEASKSVSA